MADRPEALITRLEAVKDRFEKGAVETKLDLLRRLSRRRLKRAGDVHRLHECLCYLRAHPDDQALLDAVEEMLSGFSERRDLLRHRRELADTGIAGTAINYRFYWSTAKWLVRGWPDQVSIDWSEFEHKGELESLMHLLAAFGRSPALDMFDAPLDGREWIDRLKGPSETDAAFLIRRFAHLRVDEFLRDVLYERLDVPLTIAASPSGPSRSRAKHPGAPVAFQTRPLSTKRPDLRREIGRTRLSVRAASRREASALIDLWREALVTRHRDTLAAEYADEDDVRVASADRGLQFAIFGAVPARRPVLETLHGYMSLRNGVPIGYGTMSTLFGSTEIAFNVFETFRGAEAAWVLARLMGAAHQLFRSDAFTIDAYQLGSGNSEALRSGAWWFYYKLGFRPKDPDVRRLVREERARLARNPRHRSSVRTLELLAADTMDLHLGKPRTDILGRLSTENVGLRVARAVAERFGADRERAFEVYSQEVAERLGVRSMRKFSAGERLAWARWSPLVMLMPNVSRWPAAAKKDLAQIIRLKGSRRDSDYQLRFDRHLRLRRAILDLTRNE